MSESSFKKEPVNIVVTFDENYAFGAGVMLNSVLQNTKRQLSIFILHPGLTDNVKEEFESLISQYADQASIEFIQVTSELFDSMHVVEYLSTVAFYRLLIPDLLPAEECRAIYLDPDLIVETDIGKLWDCSLDDFALGGIYAPAMHDTEGIISKGERWFNSGVLLMDLNAWRKLGLTSKCLKQCELDRDRVTHDQEMLRIVMKNQCKELPEYWNKETVFYQGPRTSEQAGIVHFTGSVKPWHYACFHPKRSLFYTYRKGTPWADRKLEGQNIISMIVRWLPFRLALFLSTKIRPSNAYSVLRRVLMKDS